MSTVSSVPMSLVRHFVAFKYLPEVTPEERLEVRQRFLAMCTECKRNERPYIVSIETGRATSKEGADQSFLDGFLVTFTSESDRNYYVGKLSSDDPNPDFDPVHDAFKTYIGKKLAVDAQGNIIGAFVFDFSVEASCEGR